MAALIIGDDANRMVRKPTFNVIQSPARLLTVRTMRETPLDLKGYGLCRERHCLWAVPLLIFCLIRTSFVERLALQFKT